MKKCPYCAEEIQDDAIKCKHCGEMIKKPVKTKTVYICPRCSKQYDNTWKVCINCSVPLQMKEIEIKDNGDINLTESCGTKLTCPRCGHKDSPDKFANAFSEGICCCLAFIMILPAILYYFFRQGKKICPKCGMVF